MLGASTPWPSSFIRTFLSLPPIDNYWMCQSREETMPSRLVDTWPDVNYEVASVNWGSSVAQLITCYQTGHRSASDWCNSSPCRFVMIEPVLIVPVKQIRNTYWFSLVKIQLAGILIKLIGLVDIACLLISDCDLIFI